MCGAQRRTSARLPVNEASTGAAAPFLLARHVHVCYVEDGAIFLDLRTRKYRGLPAAECCVLKSAVLGWAFESGHDSREPRADAATVAETLAAQGLLVRDPVQGKSAEPVRISCPGAIDLDAVERRITAGHALSFLRAWAGVKLRLRFSSFENVVSRVAVLKGRNCDQRQPAADERLRQLIRAFRILRALFYTPDNSCLFDSLVLVEFLNLYDIHPTWVLGVNTRPFTAHSWVQCGDVTLNDSFQRAHACTPIMAI
jgi:hypothetical protein